MPNVELGFLEECEAWKLENRLFPSKVGGKPAWLSLKCLPTFEELTCAKCKQIMIFVCQIYAPYEDQEIGSEIWENNFHRTVFVFVCRNVKCNERNISDNVVVFRNTLRRDNEFYPFDPPKEGPDESFDVTKWSTFCNVCGIVAEKRCSRCKVVFYCCREHQVADWKNGHKVNCLADSPTTYSSELLFKEWELITETEHIETISVDEQQELEKFEKLEVEGKTGTLQDIPESQLDDHATSEKDKIFSKFKEKVSYYPDQVIRYSRGGQPLLIAREPVPINIPDCELCGSPRQFEFQIMPQMLSALREINVDWGVLLVYTCRNSCVGESFNSYKREFIFKQDVSLSNSV